MISPHLECKEIDLGNVNIIINFGIKTKADKYFKCLNQTGCWRKRIKVINIVSQKEQEILKSISEQTGIFF